MATNLLNKYVWLVETIYKAKRITYDFLQEILHNGENVEVLEPLWLREEIAGITQCMSGKYNKQD